ncbi:hypothetical protein P7K49_005132 [Saguinus oedipus]|uniref:Uncharacterized protein n=1 Tax=Saguinus oedipus TaxID=9490 RepID=A0ABQ9W9Y0_SAGOE|nr:hypothetical protein P7K49_005132 [Saguinus oedipus]
MAVPQDKCDSVVLHTLGEASDEAVSLRHSPACARGDPHPPGRAVVGAQYPSTRTGREEVRRLRKKEPAATALSDRSALRVINGPGGAAVSAPQRGGPAPRRWPRRPPARPSLLGPASLRSHGDPMPMALGLTPGESRRADTVKAGHRWMRQRQAAGGHRGTRAPAAGLGRSQARRITLGVPYLR